MAILPSNHAPTGSVLLRGQAVQGLSLSVSHSLADADGLGTIQYVWLADGQAIARAEGPSYTLTQNEVGKVITVLAQYVDAAGTPESVSSNASGPVANVNDLPQGTVLLSGLPQTGQVLSVTQDLSDADGMGTVNYQWLANGVAVSGATGSQWTPGVDQWGQAISVVAWYTDATGQLESKTSGSTARVTDAQGALPSAPTHVALTIQPGPISGATLFLDQNANGVADAGERTAWCSDVNGQVSASLTSAQGGASQWLALGGTDVSTGLTNRMILSAPLDASVISPVTSLLLAMVARGSTWTEAQQTLIQALGLAPQLDLLHYDPLRFGGIDADALPVQKVNVLISTLVELSGNTSAVLGALAQWLMQWPMASGPMDWTDPDLFDAFWNLLPASVAGMTGLKETFAGGLALIQAVGSMQELSWAEQGIVSAYLSDDFLAPNWLMITPSQGNTSVSLESPLVLTFDENILIHSGSGITLKNPQGVDVAMTATVQDDQLTLVPLVPLQAATAYVLTLSPGSVTDMAGNAFVGHDWSFSTVLTDTLPPRLVNVSPDMNAARVPLGSPISLVFDESVVRGSGSLWLKTLSGTVVESFDVATSQRLSISGRTVTLDPTLDLQIGTAYRLELPSGTFRDGAGNAFAGASSLRFTTLGVSTGLTGTDGDDSLTGGAGNDLFKLGLGHDTVSGGAGLDRVQLAMFPNVYALSSTGGVITGTYQEGSLSLNSIEQVEFGHQFKTVLGVDALLNGRMQEGLAQLTDLYLAFFGRAPDVAGLEYWMQCLFNGGKDLSLIAKDFSWSTEAQTLFPASAGNREFVQLVYINSFGRSPDQAGWDWWTAQLDRLNPSDPDYLNNRGGFVGQLLLGAYAPTSGPEDRTLLIHKHDLALDYVNQLSLQSDRSFDVAINTLLSRVTGDSSTLSAARGVLDYVFDHAVTLTGVMQTPALIDSIWASY